MDAKKKNMQDFNGSTSVMTAIRARAGRNRLFFGFFVAGQSDVVGSLRDGEKVCGVFKMRIVMGSRDPNGLKKKMQMKIKMREGMLQGKMKGQRNEMNWIT